MTDTRQRVWRVERGEYSDARTHGVYSTEAIANAVASKIVDATSVEELVIDEDVGNIPPDGFAAWEVAITSTGDVTHVERVGDRAASIGTSIGITYDSYETEVRPTACLTPHNWLVSPVVSCRTGRLKSPVPLVVHCWARDEDHACKIAGEQRIKWIAMELPGLVAAGIARPQ